MNVGKKQLIYYINRGVESNFFKLVEEMKFVIAGLLIVLLQVAVCNGSRNCGECPRGEFCAYSKQGGSDFCKPFSSLGESCGGFVAVESRCDEDKSHFCAHSPSERTDSTGICVQKCDSLTCPHSHFCSTNKHCLKHGTCVHLEDCANPANEADLPRCVYNIYCEKNTCIYECEDFCQSSDDCQTGWECFREANQAQGTCAKSCTQSFQCPQEYRCTQGVCTYPHTGRLSSEL
jgi:hypothetical protein